MLDFGGAAIDSLDSALELISSWTTADQADPPSAVAETRAQAQRATALLEALRQAVPTLRGGGQ